MDVKGSDVDVKGSDVDVKGSDVDVRDFSVDPTNGGAEFAAASSSCWSICACNGRQTCNEPRSCGMYNDNYDC